MKNLYTLYFILLISMASFGQVISTETFSYDDGPLLGNGTWSHHSGPQGDLLVTSGQAAVSHAFSEDMNLPFETVTGNVYYAFDMTVLDPGTTITGSDNEYFAHFKDSGAGFFARVDLSAPTNGGDYVIGLSTISTEADITWASDLIYGTTYRVTVRFDQDEIIAQLWLDASTESDTSIVSNDETGSDASIASFALRQSGSADNETILVDNLKVAQSYNGTSLSTQEFIINSSKVYPNPTSIGFVNITSANKDVTTVIVYDILGKEVMKETLSNNRLNVSALNAGVYILKIAQNDASVTKKLVIK